MQHSASALIEGEKIRIGPRHALELTLTARSAPSAVSHEYVIVKSQRLKCNEAPSALTDGKLMTLAPLAFHAHLLSQPSLRSRTKTSDAALGIGSGRSPRQMECHAAATA